MSSLHIFKSLWIEYQKRGLRAAVFSSRHQVAFWLAADQLTSLTLLLQRCAYGTSLWRTRVFGGMPQARQCIYRVPLTDTYQK